MEPRRRPDDQHDAAADDNDLRRRRDDVAGGAAGTSAAAAAARGDGNGAGGVGGNASRPLQTASGPRQTSIMNYLVPRGSAKVARPSAEAAEAPVVQRRSAAAAAAAEPGPAPPPPRPSPTPASPPPPPTSRHRPMLAPLLDPYVEPEADPAEAAAAAAAADQRQRRRRPASPPPRLPPHRSEHLSWNLALAETGSGRAQMRRAALRLRTSAFGGSAQAALACPPVLGRAGPGRLASEPIAVAALVSAPATANGRHDRLLALEASGHLRLISWDALEDAAREELRAQREREEEQDERSDNDDDDDVGGRGRRRWDGYDDEDRELLCGSDDDDGGRRSGPRVGGGCGRRRLRRSVRRAMEQFQDREANANAHGEGGRYHEDGYYRTRRPPPPAPGVVLSHRHAQSFPDRPFFWAADCSPVRPGLFALASDHGCRLVAADEAGGRLRMLDRRSHNVPGCGAHLQPYNAGSAAPNSARDIRFFPWQSAAGSYAMAVATSNGRSPCVALHDARCPLAGGSGASSSSSSSSRAPCALLQPPPPPTTAGRGSTYGNTCLESVQVTPSGTLVYGATRSGHVFEWDVRRSGPGGGGGGSTAMSFGAGGPSRHALVRSFDMHALTRAAFGDGGGGGQTARSVAQTEWASLSHALLDPAAPWRLACVRDDRRVVVLDLRPGVSPAQGVGHGRATHLASAESPCVTVSAADVLPPGGIPDEWAGLGEAWQSCWDAEGGMLYTQGGVHVTCMAPDPEASHSDGELVRHNRTAPAVAALDLGVRSAGDGRARVPRGLRTDAARRALKASEGLPPAQWWRRGWQAVSEPVCSVTQRGDGGGGALAVGTENGQVHCIGHGFAA
jgi:hypothetical protein